MFNTVGEVEEYSFNTISAGIRVVYVVFDHIVEEALAAFWQKLLLICVNLIGVLCKLLEWYRRIIAEAPGQQVIEIDIYQYAAVFFKAIIKEAFTFFKLGMHIGKGVYLPVHQNAFHDPWRVAAEVIAAQMVGNEIPGQQLAVAIREESMREIIHVQDLIL